MVSHQVLHNRIAFTRRALKCFAVEDADVTPSILNQAATLQASSCRVHARTLCTEHLREKLLREKRHGATDSVLDHEQPASQPLLQAMKAVASCNLTPYQAANLNGFKNATAKGLACREIPLKFRIGDPQGCALDPDQSNCRN